jgi:hypothetical protein
MALILHRLVQQGHLILGFREVMTDLEGAFLALTSSARFGHRITDE